MSAREFEFDLYRLVIVDRNDDLFSNQRKALNGDKEILEVFKNLDDEKLDEVTETAFSTFKWSVRNFIHFEATDDAPEVASFALARTALEQTGPVVSKDSITVERIQPDQSLAHPIRIVFYVSRHLFAIEHNSNVISSNKWLSVLHIQLDKACDNLGYRNVMRLEPKPKNEEVMKVFYSFNYLTRFRAHLRLPNPEIDRHAKQLFDEMKSGKVRDFILDIRNSNGLNMEDGSLANSAARLVEAGYKEGSTVLEGFQNGIKTKKVTGKKAARGRLANLREFIRGQETVARTRETKQALVAIILEIDQIAPHTDKEST